MASTTPADTTIPSPLNPPVRVLIWTVPRSLGTVLFKCLSFIPGAQIFYECFLSAWEIGPERSPVECKEFDDLRQIYSELDKIVPEMDRSYPDTNWYDSNLCTYDWVKNKLESSYDPDVKMVFSKDLAFAMTGQYDKIPQGYQHVFLIRNPWRLMLSWMKLCSKRDPTEDNSDTESQRFSFSFDTKYAALMKLYTYIAKHHQKNPLIIDADDLQNHTASILSQFLEAVGVPYQDSFLQFDQSDDFSKRWILPKMYAYFNITQGDQSCYYNAFNSTCFRPTKEVPSKESLPEDVVGMVQSVMPLYEELYQLRLKPNEAV